MRHGDTHMLTVSHQKSRIFFPPMPGSRAFGTPLRWPYKPVSSFWEQDMGGLEKYRTCNAGGNQVEINKDELFRDKQLQNEKNTLIWYLLVSRPETFWFDQFKPGIKPPTFQQTAALKSFLTKRQHSGQELKVLHKNYLILYR